MHDLARDVRHALRRLRATPAFTVFAIVSLALGLGAATAVASIVRAVFGLPQGVRDAGAIVNVYQAPRASGTASGAIEFSWPDFQDLNAHQTVFDAMTAWAPVRQAFAGNGRAETGFGEVVAGEYFRMLGVAASLGRTLQPGDDRVDAPPVAVISHRVWQRMFDGDPNVVGRFIKMNGHRFEIVGVAPAAFHGLFNGGVVSVGVWLPIASVPLLPAEGMGISAQQRDRRWLSVKGRLKPGRTLAEAQAEITGIAEQIDAAYPRRPNADHGAMGPDRVGRPWSVIRSTDVIINENADHIVRPLAGGLLTAVGLVLLVACTNLANLMLARGSARRHEVAVRLALGGSRWRLIRESLSESVLLAGAGGLVGLGVARVLLVMIGTDLSVGHGAALHLEPGIDGLVAGAAAAAALLALAVGGVVPALQTTRADVRTELASGGSGGALLRWRGRRVLIATQVMVSLVLLSLAAASVDVVRRDSRDETGLDLERLALADVDFGLQQYDTARARQIVDAVLIQMARHPDVNAVAASSGLPIGVATPGGSVRSAETSRASRVELLAATPGILRTLGVSLVRGRGLDDRDTSQAERVIVLSERAAKALFGTADPIGRQVIFTRATSPNRPTLKDEPASVVGVAADTDTGSPGQRDHGTAYLPLDQHDEGRLVLSVRTTGDPEALVNVLRRALASVDPDVAVLESGTGVAVAAPSNLFMQVTAGLASLLGAFALALALAGLYGALSHVISRRVREIGVRLALGATASGIVRLVVREGLSPAVFGIAIGLVAGFLARLSIPSFVVVQLLPPFNPFALIVAPGAMLLAALIACYLPARRAARVDPNVALRDL